MNINKRIFLLVITMFIIGTDGFVMAGLLKQIAATAHVSVAMAGQLITVFSITFAISGPIFASLFGDIDRKTVFIGALIVFTIGNLIVALSTNYFLLVVGRIVCALGASALTPVATMIAGAIAPPEERGRYISFVISGVTIATIVGVPLGTFAGNGLGYQSIFLTIAILGILVSIILLKTFGSVPPPPKLSIKKRLLAFGIDGAPFTLLVTVIVFISTFTVYSYISAYFSSKGIIGEGYLSWILLSFGVGGTIGNLLGGILTDKLGPKTTIVISMLGIIITFLLISTIGNELPLVILLTFMWGIFGWVLSPSQQYRLIKIGGDQSQVLISWNASGMYLGIGISGMIGAFIINNLGVKNLTWFGSGCALIAVILVLLTYDRRKA